MPWRNIVIANPATLSFEKNSMVINQDDTEYKIPVDDIGSVILESMQINITGRLLSEIGKSGASLFACDEKFIPCGIFLSFSPHSRNLKVLRMQLDMKLPFKKRCWQSVVTQKIINQALCLKYLGYENYKTLMKASSGVNPGDTENIESFAARFYFGILWPQIYRNDDNVINSALNYGYAVLRGAVSRSLVNYGFLPLLGIHHGSELNRFNLADDLMEIYRPVVDMWVAENIEEKTAFDKKIRSELVGLLHNNIEVAGEIQSIMRSIDMLVSSFTTACMEKNPKKIKLPVLIKTEKHNYE